MLYAKSTGGFYSPEINGTNIPSDAIEISDDKYQSLLAAQSSGKVIEAGEDGRPIAAEPPAPTPAQIRTAKVAFVQALLDKKAQSLGYDNIYTAVSYADEPAVPKFQLEGQALRAWRSLVWAKANDILAAVTAGTQAIPTDEALIAALPTFEPPST